jgi:hypothetical protein
MNLYISDTTGSNFNAYGNMNMKMSVAYRHSTFKELRSEFL